MNSELQFRDVMKRIDLYGRLAYGGQIVAAMAMIAGPALFIACTILPFALWDDDRAEALAVWLGGWAIALGVTVAGAAFAVFCWRWSGDWITEWPGYAVGVGAAAVANAVCAWMLMSTPVPVPLSFALAAAGAFAVGFLVAGNLAGTQVLEETRRPGARALARRR
jgi:hypothetical protein